jgi:Fur family ferric uptake transcriptional regulator
LLERFRTWLRDRNLPITRQRDLVAAAIFGQERHVSVDELRRLVREAGHPIGAATVYRVLDVLVESGLVHAHNFGEGFKRFEPIRRMGEHGHLICSGCGQVTEFSTERFERLLPIVADEHEFQHQSHRIEIHGLCRECQGT